ncbi:phospholipase A and acyltransferase 1-like [Branchiostoma floridae]|uniref:Phospholipase A and acyltransferase 1-like n=1 Tax=Branchiostoma floridae TaxID=7739 RepID=A0A9J7HGG3_BRAFL|nr:phospholipase A and acyltransferase 1-like [Branchiostoma floridae]
MALTSEWKGPPESWTSLNFQVGDLIEIQENDHTSWALYLGHAQVVYAGPSPDQHSTNQDTASSANQNTTHAPGGDSEATNQSTAAGTNEKDSNIQYQVKKGLLKAVIGQHTVRINNMYDSTRKAFPVQTIVERAELHIGETVRDKKDAIVNLRYERQMRVWHL